MFSLGLLCQMARLPTEGRFPQIIDYGSIRSALTCRTNNRPLTDRRTIRSDYRLRVDWLRFSRQDESPAYRPQDDSLPLRTMGRFATLLPTGRIASSPTARRFAPFTVYGSICSALTGRTNNRQFTDRKTIRSAYRRH